MVIKCVSHDHYMKLWHCLVDDKEIIGTGSTNYGSFNPGFPYSRNQFDLCTQKLLTMYAINTENMISLRGTVIRQSASG